MGQFDLDAKGLKNRQCLAKLRCGLAPLQFHQKANANAGGAGQLVLPQALGAPRPADELPYLLDQLALPPVLCTAR